MAADGSLAGHLRHGSNCNLPFPTLGGEVFWEDLLVCHGWRVQRHLLLGNCRILDGSNLRHAWGSLSYLEELLLGHPPSRLSNYFVAGNCFHHYPAVGDSVAWGQVFLLHGLFNRAHNMSFLARQLSIASLGAHNYDYPTCGDSIAGHGQTFLRQWRRQIATLPSDSDLFFLTHSLGGIVLRVAMSQMSAEECGRIKAIVMLAPPNRGSHWPDILTATLPLTEFLAKPLADLRTDASSAVNQIPLPPIMPPLGIIRARGDKKVTNEQTELRGVQCEYITIAGAHWQLPMSDQAANLAMAFFRAKKFAPA